MKPILIVDDEAPIRALIRLTLERAGYTCDEAATGTEAADKIEANTYDLALLDIMLPGPDGYELLDYLRSVQTPVIFLTAKTAVADRVRGLHLGADGLHYQAVRAHRACGTGGSGAAPLW